MDDKKTPSDAKLEPKVSVEQALKVLQPKVEALLKETLSGFELAAEDKKSRKRIFGALVTAAAGHMQKEEKLSLGSLSRRCSRAISSLYPQSAPPAPHLTVHDGGLDDDSQADEGEGDDSDD